MDKTAQASSRRVAYPPTGFVMSREWREVPRERSQDRNGLGSNQR